MKAEQGGALLLARMVGAATSVEVITHEITEIENISPETIIHSISILDSFPWKKGKKALVFRIRHLGGYYGPRKGTPKSLLIAHDDAEAELIVLDDAGYGFREERNAWPQAILNNDKKSIIVLKMSRPLASGALWDHLVKERSNELIVVIDANDLREMGVNISRRLSWEQTAEDFCWQILNNPRIRPLAGSRNLIVRFGLDGAIHYSKNGDNIKAVLYYDSQTSEDGYREQHPGEMKGKMAAFVAALTSEIFAQGIRGIDIGIKEGILRSRQLHRLGFGDADEEPARPLSMLSDSMNDAETIFSIPIPIIVENAFSGGGNWRILEECTRGKLETIAYNAVIRPPEDSMREVPQARFGALYTLDRSEIESYQSINNLMTEYLKIKDVKAPLSIAVFGPPGSGKSFGVAQLAKSIDPDLVVIREFNVAQFTSIDDLTDAFHKVRDLVLEGKVPLVFFDEFDVFYNGELGWLKYFLAPMQDGAFKEGETTHPIGKSIFVFAGGTSDSFQQFFKEHTGGEQSVNMPMMKRFRDAKGTDFVSRLRGYVNVMGPNRTGDDDEFFIIRRALLLRSLLIRKAPQIFDGQGNARVDPAILRGFLKVPSYKHGSRSMEAIIEMSTLSGKMRFEQASLPPAKQLELHVDSEMFSKLVLRDVLLGDAMERLARGIYEQNHLDREDKKYPDDAPLQSWENLDEYSKELIRKQAQQIPEQLRRIGLDFMPFFEKPSTSFVLSAEEVEILAEMKHKQQVKERSQEGWAPRVLGDPERKVTFLIPWSQLPEEVKERDREAVRRIPELLKMSGFEVYKLQ
ncbi:MAG: hypothetical protein SA339_05355 [Methanomassiliicoccus sp.]|nr:hypothetical protein [Methanomassiliicoccus sp.]